MSVRLPALGLKVKIVVALSVAVLAILAAFVSYEMERFRIERMGELRATAQNLANLYSGAVASSVWEFDKDNTRSQLEALKVVEGFQRAVIWETNGPEFVAVSSRIADGPHVEGKAKILVNGKEIAWIMVRLSRNVVAAAEERHLKQILYTVAALAVALLTSLFAALHFLTRPLDRMTNLMQRFATGQLGGQIPFVARNDEVGRMAQALAVFRDHAIERRNAELALHRRSEELTALNKDLLKARDAAESANRIKSEFLASMSHEIRTPMNGIVGMVHVLMSTPLQQDQREKLSTLASAASTLLSILNDILDISKIEAGRLELDVAPFLPRRMLDDMMALWRPSALNKGLSFKSQVDPDVPAVMIGDANRIGQIVANYLGNAIKFTERGSVAVHLSGQPKGDGSYRLRVVGHRHRHRHRVRHHPAAVPEVQPGRQLDHAQVRRHRPRPRHLPRAGAADGRRSRRRQHARQGFDLLGRGRLRDGRFHRPAAAGSGFALAPAGAARRAPAASAGGRGQPGQPGRHLLHAALRRPRVRHRQGRPRGDRRGAEARL